MKRTIVHQAQIKCICLLLLTISFITACTSKPPTPEEMYKEESSGVVMVLNKFYYSATMPNGEHLYFTGIDGNGSLIGLTDDINEIKRNSGYLTGTAFFVDDKGSLLTNRHVASPTIDEAQVKQCLMNIVRFIKSLYEGRMNELMVQYNTLEEQNLIALQLIFGEIHK